MDGDGCSTTVCVNRTFNQNLVDIIAYALVMGGFIWLLATGAKNLGYNWQWYQIPQYLFTWDNGFHSGPLLKGLYITLHITAISLVLAFCIGLATALSRMQSSVVLRILARIYMESIRNSPLLIQIFIFYFVIAPILNISAFWSAVLALSLFEGAYASEIIRAGITSIDTGQFEAARGLGMSNYAMYRYVILPQAIRRILPPLTNQAISLVKDSALVSTIAIFDLTMQGQTIVAETFLTFEIWFTVGALYLLVTLILSRLVVFLEQRMRLHANQ